MRFIFIWYFQNSRKWGVRGRCCSGAGSRRSAVCAILFPPLWAWHQAGCELSAGPAVIADRECSLSNCRYCRHLEASEDQVTSCRSKRAECWLWCRTSCRTRLEMLAPGGTCLAWEQVCQAGRIIVGEATESGEALQAEPAAEHERTGCEHGDPVGNERTDATGGQHRNGCKQ